MTKFIQCADLPSNACLDILLTEMIVFANVGILKIFARDKMHLYTKGSLYTLTESELQIFTLCSSCVEYNSSFIQANFAINMH